MTRWHVWIHVEKIDEDTDTYEDIDLPVGSTVDFATQDEAVAFALNLHATNEGAHT